MLTKIDLCSMALLKIGEKPIQSFMDDTAAAELSRTLFDTITDSLLTMHPWKFATKKYHLVKNNDDDFQIPSEVLRVLSCSAVKYEITGQKITAPSDNICITAISRCGVENWPAYFVSMAATKLAMEFCMPLTDNQNSFGTLGALYENEQRTAKFIDSTITTSDAISEFSLLSARF